jgi:RNA polymerase sigma factor (sigma-70 family)
MSKRGKPGRPEAARALVQELASDKHRARLHRFLLRRLSHWEDARDLMQEIYIRLLRIPDAEFVRDPVAYMYRTAIRVLNAHKRTAAQAPITFDSNLASAQAERRSDLQLDECLQKVSLDRQITRAVSRLPQIYRDVLLLRLSGLSKEQISIALGVSPHTVKKYATRALALLKQFASMDR